MTKKTNEPGAHKQGSQHITARGRKRWLIVGAAAIAALTLGVVTLFPRPQVAAVNAGRVGDGRTLGPRSAPVTIVEYGDFGCTACKAWHAARVLEELRAQYGEDIHFVWRDFPVITPQSPKAAEAAHCANDQGRFWEYHDLLLSATGIRVDQLKTYAGEMRLDVAMFNQCLDSGRHGPTVDRDLQDAIERGFRGTPAFLVNDQPLTLGGPPTFGYFQRLVNPLLASGG